MPDREYFSFRYAIPGYTFLLLVVLINHIPLLTILGATEAGQVFGAFLAFLSLFTGSAIGFLVSQFWWLYFSHGDRIFGVNGYETLRDFLIEMCRRHGLIEETEARAPMGAILDYIRHRKKEDETSRLSERRWDMYHVLSSTSCALLIGLGVGIGLRIYYEWFILEPHFKIPLFETSLGELISTLDKNAEGVALLVILVCVGILLVIFWRGSRRLMTNYRPLLEAFIRREIREVGEELAIVFPDYFQYNNNPEN